jgi:hypothetical protein
LNPSSDQTLQEQIDICTALSDKFNQIQEEQEDAMKMKAQQTQTSLESNSQ